MLEWKGWTVEACMDGEVALQKIEGERQYDLIILDQQLPEFPVYNYCVARIHYHIGAGCRS